LIIGGIALFVGAQGEDAVRIEEAGVRVDISYVGADRGEVIAMFEPLNDGYHLYGPEMPAGGIDGAGRPTLVELADGSAWRATDALAATPATTLQRLPTFDQPFPVFPAGPVTLRLPVERDTGAAGSPLAVAVTYMTCSDTGICLAPVEGRMVILPTPR
jgi:Thiol:disulfide interchange protein DsbD, N-terminal